MSLPVAYWDSSALAPLCVAQPQSAEASLLYEQFSIVTWWATRVEIMRGLTQLERMGQISAGLFLVGKSWLRLSETDGFPQDPNALQQMLVCCLNFIHFAGPMRFNWQPHWKPVSTNHRGMCSSPLTNGWLRPRGRLAFRCS